MTALETEATVSTEDLAAPSVGPAVAMRRTRTMSVTSEQYVARKGLVCPDCESRDINMIDSGTVHESASFTIGIYCDACKATWTDRYVLESYFDLENE